MLKYVVQERGRRLAVKVKGERRVFPSRDNFCYIAQELIRNIRNYLKCEGASPIYVWLDAIGGDLHFNYCRRKDIFGDLPRYVTVIYDVAKRFAGDAWQYPPPNDKTIRDELAQALVSVADEEREFIFAYYRRNASQKRRENFQRKERRQRRNNGN